MKAHAPILVVLSLLALFVPVQVMADGMFVAPKFVWDKHKDINEPTQKAILLYNAGHEDMILQVKYEGPVSEFGWLVPVPNLPTVKNGSMQCFYELSQYTQRKFEGGVPGFETRSISGAYGPANDSPQSEPPVKVVETKTIGAYKIAILSTKDTGALEQWLNANQFSFPSDKADVINDYVQRHWYFIAVKIDLDSSSTSGTSQKLASGELNPLQISFASDQCVFPLKISSANGKPSEVQLYVLSRQALVERTMFEKKFPEVRRAAIQQYHDQIQALERARENSAALMIRRNPKLARNAIYQTEPLDTNAPMSTILKMSPGELLNYTPVNALDLPKCARALPPLNHATWWLTKQTWTFQPDEMQDLVFQPAVSVFVQDLAGDAGYYVAKNLVQLGNAAASGLVTALQSPDPAVRIHAAYLVDWEGNDNWTLRNPRVHACLSALLQDPEPEVRQDAAMAAGSSQDPKLEPALVHLMRDGDAGVREAAMRSLDLNYRGKFENDPAVKKLLADPDLGIRATAVEALGGYDTSVPTVDLLPLLTWTNAYVVNVALMRLGRDGITYDEIAPVFQNPLMNAQLEGLRFITELDDNADPDAIDLVMAQLHNSFPRVSLAAGLTLQKITGQNIPEDQPAQWEQWWAKNRTVYTLEQRNRYIQQNPGGRGYHDRGCAYYDMGRYADALADFRTACKLGSDAVDYSACRVWLAEMRLDEKSSASRELTGYLARCKGNPHDWSASIIHYLLSQMTEDDLLNASDSPGTETAIQQRCEAYFYIGSKHLLDGDQPGATDDFKKCLATKVTTFQEYQSAAAELARLSAREISARSQ